MEPVMIEEDGVSFDALETDDEKFEFAQYVVNTPPEDRPEVSEADAALALQWMESQN